MFSSASSSSPPSEASLSQSTISQHLLHLILDKMGLCRHLFLDSNLEAWQQEIEALVLDSDAHSLLSTFLSDEYVRPNVASYFKLCVSTPRSSSLSRSRSLAQPSHSDKKIHRAFTSERLLTFFKKAIAAMESLCEWEAMEIIAASCRYRSHNPNPNPNPFFCPDVFCKKEFQGFKQKDFITVFRRVESFHGHGHDHDHHDGNRINSFNCIDFYFLTLHTLARVSAIDLAKTRIHMHQCRVLQVAYNRISHFFREFVQLHALAGTWHSFLSTLSLFQGVGKELCRLLIHGHRYLEDYNRHGWSSLSIPNMLSQSRLMTFLEDLDFLCKHLISKAQIILDMSFHNHFKKLPNLDLSELQFLLTKAAESDHQALHAELHAFCSDTGQAQQIERPSPRDKPSHDQKSPIGKSILRSIWSNIRPIQSPETPSRDDSFQSDVLFKARWLSQSLPCHIKLELETSKNLFIAPEYVKRGNLLGEGSFAKVYEATCWGDKYAMKQLYADAFSSRDEIFLQFRLPHPNIVRVIGYTSGVEGEQVRALLMELMSKDLRSHLDSLRPHSDGGSPFQQVVAVDIMLQIAKAMEHLHRQQILHRDLKASNVLIDRGRSADYWEEGYLHVKVADFGNARGFQKRDLTAPIGTSHWRAPEITSNLKEYKGLLNNQCSSTRSTYGLPADVYSFGITCFEIVSGELPYKQESEANTYLLQRIVGGFRPTLPGEIHSGLADLIKACWHGNPEQRPPFTEICTTLSKIKSELLHDV